MEHQPGEPLCRLRCRPLSPSTRGGSSPASTGKDGRADHGLVDPGPLSASRSGPGPLAPLDGLLVSERAVGTHELPLSVNARPQCLSLLLGVVLVPVGVWSPASCTAQWSL